MKKLIPIVLAVAGLGAGLGAGVLMRPSGEAAAETRAPEHADAGGHSEPAPEPGETELVPLANQFVVPVIDSSEVSALVVLSLDLEVAEGSRPTVERLEPKLRDAFLSVLFDHSNAGGFHGAFTSAETLGLLRDALRESAETTLGEAVHRVLITDIVRQRV